MAIAAGVIERVDATVTETGGTPAAVSWGAILGGAFLIAATAMVILVLGAGFGLSTISPWQTAGATATKFAVVSAIWLIVAQWVSSGVGGYVAGRLRLRWSDPHVDESYFRDTAHGILAWAVAAVITVVFLSSAISSVVGGAAQGGLTLGASASQGAAQGRAQSTNPASPDDYLVDTLFRKEQPDADVSSGQDAHLQATRILTNGLVAGEVPAADKAYLAQLVMARTGVSQEEAQKRVDDVIANAQEAREKAREAAEAARKAARDLSFFVAFSMLIGAFIAGVAAKIGGHHRDDFAVG
jgi:hypothetical protein